MASGGKRGGGDRILESRHLAGLFLGVVLLCGVFFTLGYVMGRTQYGGSVHAETLSSRAVPASVTQPAANIPAAATVPPPQDWDFSGRRKDTPSEPAALPKTVTDQNMDAGFNSPSMTEPAIPPPAALVTTSSKTRAIAAPAPKSATGSIVLQVAALTRQSDAMWMASVLQKKHFPAFIVDPVRGDALYHVQVGPYADERAADAARTALDHDGFKVIIKR